MLISLDYPPFRGPDPYPFEVWVVNARLWNLVIEWFPYIINPSIHCPHNFTDDDIPLGAGAIFCHYDEFKGSAEIEEGL